MHIAISIKSKNCGHGCHTMVTHCPAFCCSVDTACSSSLVAAHLVMVHMGSRTAAAGLVGGVSVLLSPTTTAMFQKAGMLASDGRCKTIDAAADGYVRGEGCGVVLLQSEEAAESQHAPVLAVFQGSAVNQDGRSSSLTAPNGPSQQAAIRQALQAAALEPHRMTALQLHGTGTPLGDPIELGAVQAVLMGNSHREQPVQIAAAKSWIGHTEAASGVMGLLQAALGLQQLTAPCDALHCLLTAVMLDSACRSPPIALAYTCQAALAF